MIKADKSGCITYCPGIQSTNTPSYKYVDGAINYCVSDCYTKLNTNTINTDGTECILITACTGASNVISSDNKNCLTACPAG